MPARTRYYRCGACQTKNVYARALAVPYGQEGWLLIISLACRRCRAGRSIRTGIDPWRGEPIEAALLRPENRPSLAAEREAMERLGERLTGAPQALAEEARIRAALRPYPIPTRSSLRLLKGGKR
jgi:hypothetical protein